jgi:Immunity protein 63
MQQNANLEKWMEFATLPEIKAEIDSRAALLGASANMLPTYGVSRDFGYPHIEVDSAGYHYVVVERGQELKRITTPQLDELLYTVFESIAFSLAGRYEVNHRIKGEDCRRLMFGYQVELLAMLDPTWAARCAAKHRQILEKNPFQDR